MEELSKQIAAMDSLFKDDEAFNKQEEAISNMEKVHNALAFLKYKLLDSCENCVHRGNDGKCYVMQKYGVEPFEVEVLAKCSQWKERK